MQLGRVFEFPWIPVALSLFALAMATAIFLPRYRLGMLALMSTSLLLCYFTALILSYWGSESAGVEVSRANAVRQSVYRLRIDAGNGSAGFYLMQACGETPPGNPHANWQRIDWLYDQKNIIDIYRSYPMFPWGPATSAKVDGRLFGFALAYYSDPPNPPQRSVPFALVITLPGWFVLLLLAVLPLFWLKSIKVRKNLPEKCRCGYDLRAHKPGDKCPECGRPVPTPASKSVIEPSPRAQNPSQ